MPLDDLTGVIESLRERIGTHRASLGQNETRTRMALVDPLLKALGWDVSDPEVVTPEFKVSGGWADYALLHTGEQPTATVEAKKLGERLASSHKMQMLTYANAAGIDFAALTDGDHWELYDVFWKGTLEERRMLDVSVSTDPVHEVALKLLLLWRPNLTSGEPVEVGKPIVEPEPSTIASAEAGPAPAAEPESPGWVPLVDYEKSSYGRSSGWRPSAIRFWDGSVRSVGRWHEVLTATVEKLYSEKLLTERHTPILSRNGSNHLVNTEPPDGQGVQLQEKNRGNTLVCLCAWQPGDLEGENTTAVAAVRPGANAGRHASCAETQVESPAR